MERASTKDLQKIVRLLKKDPHGTSVMLNEELAEFLSELVVLRLVMNKHQREGVLPLKHKLAA
jgi:hypothetical protein